MDPNETFVNAIWEDHSPMTHGRFDICDMEGNFDYKAAAKFTTERLQEIANVEEEIAYLHNIMGKAIKVAPKHCVHRILALEMQRLTELKKGMRGIENEK